MLVYQQVATGASALGNYGRIASKKVYTTEAAAKAAEDDFRVRVTTPDCPTDFSVLDRIDGIVTVVLEVVDNESEEA